MKKLEIAILFLLIAVPLSASQSSQIYWFQTGVRAANSAAFNNGTSIYIQTVYPQNISYGSMAFWVGEDLSNGAFIQEGYEVNNRSGYYPTNCTLSGCSAREYISKGIPVWFWEYFPGGYSGDSFLGFIGPNNSVGQNGSYNNYTFYSSGSEWHFLFNGNTIGKINLGTGTSGANPVTAFGEYADAMDNKSYMVPVAFKDLQVLKNGTFSAVAKAYAYKGYGKGSAMTLNNPYNISEITPYANYFRVGSGIPNMQGLLWNTSAIVSINSRYANLTTHNTYTLFSKINIAAPKIFYINDTARAIFLGWSGKGNGSYTGNATSFNLEIYNNVSETAEWEVQYLVNVTSEYGNSSGSGWYPAGSVANISYKPHIYINSTTREALLGWSGKGNGSYTGNATSFNVRVDGPIDENAKWKVQYLVNVTSEYGNSSGSGWYSAGSVANISAPQYYSVGGDIYEFQSWSGTYDTSDTSFNVAYPVNLHAVFERAYRTKLEALDGYGSKINVMGFEIGGKFYNTSPYLTVGQHLVDYALYKNSKLSISNTINVTSNSTFYFNLPVYNISIYVRSYFGTPATGIAELAFSNGTHITVPLNESGEVKLKNVPFGFVEGTIQHDGMSFSFNDSTGNDIYVNVPDAILYIVITIGMLMAIVSYFIGVKVFRK